MPMMVSSPCESFSPSWGLRSAALEYGTGTFNPDEYKNTVECVRILTVREDSMVLSIIQQACIEFV